MANFSYSRRKNRANELRSAHAKKMSINQRCTAACGSHLVPSLTKSSEISERLQNFGDHPPIAAGVPTGAEGAAVCASTDGTVLSDDTADADAAMKSRLFVI
jgi:hypothetical protein